MFVSHTTVIFHIIYCSYQTHCPHPIPDCFAKWETTASWDKVYSDMITLQQLPLFFNKGPCINRFCV